VSEGRELGRLGGCGPGSFFFFFLLYLKLIEFCRTTCKASLTAWSILGPVQPASKATRDETSLTKSPKRLKSMDVFFLPAITASYRMCLLIGIFDGIQNRLGVQHGETIYAQHDA
jgi:hypothetical protein